MRVLVLGGYGQFGRRIVEGLAGDADIEVVIAGRDAAKAQVVVDVERGIAEALARVRPDVVVHTAGPFQQRGYDLARATLAAGAHYIDLADGRAFVEGFADALDDAARIAGRWAITGASSVPGISGAVVASLAQRFASIESVEIGISPGNRTERGLATTRAILGYVGQPISVLRDGAWRRAHGWQSLRRVGFDGVGQRWFARCDVPDLTLLPKRWPSLSSCDFRAGLELHRMHFGLWLASWAVRAGLVRDLSTHAESLLALSDRWRRKGSDIGVMHVDVAGGTPEGGDEAWRWSIVARDGQGPRIPATPAVLLVRKLARGALPGSGAMPCLDLFTLDECTDALCDPAFESALVRLR